MSEFIILIRYHPKVMTFQPLLFLDCADDEFLCPIEQKCISRSVVCDAYPDCTDLADEFGCGGE